MDIKHCHAPHPTPAQALEEAARAFAECGTESRPTVLRLFVRAGDEGLSVGEIRDWSGFPAFTLAQRLGFLTAGRLVEQDPRGGAVISRAAYPHLEALAAFLLKGTAPMPGHRPGPVRRGRFSETRLHDGVGSVRFQRPAQRRSRPGARPGSHRLLRHSFRCRNPRLGRQGFPFEDPRRREECTACARHCRTCGLPVTAAP
ncbi:MAG: hypothetical protein OXL68_19165 [Paracoccaceae bacterium]|nr:hypothetical protein [Paracoccaceae bacterium]